jgi:hypothetical protein
MEMTEFLELREEGIFYSARWMSERSPGHVRASLHMRTISAMKISNKARKLPQTLCRDEG